MDPGRSNNRSVCIETDKQKSLRVDGQRLREDDVRTSVIPSGAGDGIDRDDVLVRYRVSNDNLHHLCRDNPAKVIAVTVSSVAMQVWSIRDSAAIAGSTSTRKLDLNAQSLGANGIRERWCFQSPRAAVGRSGKGGDVGSREIWTQVTGVAFQRIPNRSAERGFVNLGDGFGEGDDLSLGKSLAAHGHGYTLGHLPGQGQDFRGEHFRAGSYRSDGSRSVCERATGAFDRQRTRRDLGELRIDTGDLDGLGIRADGAVVEHRTCGRVHVDADRFVLRLVEVLPQVLHVVAPCRCHVAVTVKGHRVPIRSRHREGR